METNWRGSVRASSSCVVNMGTRPNNYVNCSDHSSRQIHNEICESQKSQCKGTVLIKQLQTQTQKIESIVLTISSLYLLKYSISWDSKWLCFFLL